MAKLKFFEETVTIKNQVCTCDFEPLKEIIQTMIDQVPGWYPSVDNEAALRVAQRFNVPILELDETPDTRLLEIN